MDNTDTEKSEMPVTGYPDTDLEPEKLDSDTLNSLDAALDEAIAAAEGSEEPAPAAAPEPEIAERQTSQTPEVAQRNVAEPTQQQLAQEIDPEIASIEQPRNLSEKNQSNWRKLQETASTYKKQAMEAQALKSRIEELAKTAVTPPDYEELRKFRAFFDIENDPEFQKQFSAPMQEAKQNIYAIMKKHGAPDAVIESIEKAGGADKIDQRWWKENILDKLPFTDAERLKRHLVDAIELEEKKQAEIQKSAANINEYYERKSTAAIEWFTTQEKQVEDYIVAKIKEQGADWAMRKEVPKNATKEQADSIHRHNAQVERLEQTFGNALWPQTPQERADVAAAAAMSHILTEQLRTEQTARKKMSVQLKALTEENTRLKGAGKMPRQNSGTAAGNNRSLTINDRLKMSALDAIDIGLDEAGA